MRFLLIVKLNLGGLLGMRLGGWRVWRHEVHRRPKEGVGRSSRSEGAFYLLFTD